MNRFPSTNRQHAGFSLVELMISMVLGLALMGGVVGVFLSNREIYRQNENLARLQENARYAFEVMGRDVREAGGIACGSNLPTANVLNNASTNWWSNWRDGIHGYEGTDNTFPKAFGTAAADRVSGTDAIIVHSGTNNDGATITEHNTTSANFKVNTTAHGVKDGDILIVCDYKQAAIFQTTNASDSNVTIVHNTGSPVSPGNCSKGLGYPTVCTTNGTEYTFENGGVLNKLSANAWYIGHNGRGGRSLYRTQLTRSGSNAATVATEIAEGVTDLQVEYLYKDCSNTLATNYVPASSIPATYCPTGSTDWTKVTAARITFTLESLEKVSTGGQTLTRQWTTVATLRNRQS
jgi:type IV pilus assembly protein PilW